MKTKRSLISILTVLGVIFSNIIPIYAQTIPVYQEDKPIELASATQLVKVYYTTPDQAAQIMISFDQQILETNTQEGYHVLELTKAEIDRLQAAGFKVVIDPDLKVFEPDASIQSIPGYTCYRTVEETFATAATIASNYPNLAEWIDVGDSWEKSVGQPDGYDMMVLRLTNESIPGDKPALFVTSAIHAREYTTAELATRFAEYLIDNYNVDADVTWLLDYHEIHLMLQTNPDGRKEAEAGASWRKNTNENYCGVTSSNRGADLNRNFTYMWDCCGGSSDNPCDSTYHGAYAGSEPEAQAVMNYMQSIIPDQRGDALDDVAPLDATGVYIDLHSYGELVMWPWGFTEDSPPNGSGMQTLGRKWAYFNDYLPRQAIGLYPTDGATKDFAYGVLGIPGYTIELGTAFFQACSTFESTILPDNIPVLLYAAKAARTPYITPSGPDAVNVSVSQSSVFEGQSVTLTSQINDTRYDNSNGTEPTQNVVAAEFYVDTPYWESSATPLAMSAVDGAFNEKIEDVSFTIDTTGWSQGRHTLFVRGLDANGNWGAVSAVFLTVEVSDNEPPVADDISLSTDEDTPKAVTLTGSDPDDNPLTFSVVDAPTHGALNGTVPYLTYTPNADYNGSDSFTYKANDGIADSNIATVTINITAVNDAPIALDQSVSTEVNTPVSLVLEGSDVENDPLTFILLSNPSHGSLSVTPPNLEYTPDTSYTGSDSFTFKTNDGSVDSEVATVTITVNPPGPITVFFDDFESDLGWVEDPYGSDTATTGMWERANPEGVYYPDGYMQLDDPVSGTHDLVTGALAGENAGSHDIDNGVTTILSPEISLPAGRELTLSLYYYLAFASNATSDDFLRVSIIGDNTQILFEELGGGYYDYASWDLFSTDISTFAGQTVQILIAAADDSGGSLVEAAIDDVLIEGLLTNNPPTADPQSVITAEDTPVGITLTGSDPDGDPLTYQVTNQPINGTLSGTAPDLTYTPNADFNGADSFTFVVNDGTIDSDPATVSITVDPVNDAPVAQTQSVSLDEDATLVITLVGTDVDGDSLTYTVTSGPSYGSLSGSASTQTYTPNANYHGTDSFTFKVNDGTIDSNEATVSITVDPVNDAPVAEDQSVSLDEDGSIAVTLVGTDVDGDSLTYTVTSGPSHGSLSGSVSTRTYTPNANYHGTDSFTFKVNDGTIDSNEATVSITVKPINDAPVAYPQSVTTSEGSAITITLTGSDIDGDSLNFNVTSGPSHGTLSGTAPDLTYTPDPSYVGTDGFMFVANDGTVDSTPAAVSITVTEVNEPPVANSQSVTTNEDIALGITLTGSDPDGNPLSFEVITQPANGSLSGTAPDLTYTPNANYHGSDSFTFKVSDGQVESDPATISISVTAVNDASVAQAQSVSLDEGGELVITLVGTDVDGDDLTYTVTGEPSHGSLSGLGFERIYTPDTNFNGTDSFTFKVNDGTIDSAEATVSITVNPVNDAPIADDQFVQTDEDVALSITLTGSDIDGDSLTYNVISGPTNGILSGDAPNLTYTPNANFNGSDAFAFMTNDGTVNSAEATISITVNPINDVPAADPQSVTTTENTPISITLSGSDVDGDPLSFVVSTTPLHGTISGTAPDLTYSPDAGYLGDDSFTFTVSDGTATSDPSTVSIAITPAGPIQVFWDDFETDKGWIINPYGTDTATTGLWERAIPEPVIYYGYKQLDTTVSGVYDLVTGPLAGNNAGSYDIDGGVTSILSPEITLPSGLEVTLSFSYYLAYARNATEADYFRVTVVASGNHLVYEELGTSNDKGAGWRPMEIDLSDFGGQTIQLLIEAADAGSASLVESAVDDVLIIADWPNNPPVAESQSLNVLEDNSLPVTLTGYDADDDALTYEIVVSPMHGTLRGTLPDLVYTPDPDYYGPDGFNFTVNDGKDTSDLALIEIGVLPVNDAPVAEPVSVTTQVDIAVDIELVASDVDGDELTYSIVDGPEKGNLIGLLYTPDPGFIGSDAFTYKANDGLLDSNIAEVSITVTPAGPITVFFDDFESDQEWIFNPFGTDTAYVGNWERANPEDVYYYGYKQLGTTVSGYYDLVTGPLYGNNAGSYDIDGGVTSVRSPDIVLPTGQDITLSFSYYFAHASNAREDDYLRVIVVGSSSQTVFEELGARNDDDAYWETFSVNLNAFAGETVYLLIQAADAGSASLVEAAIDDVLIIAE